MIPKKKQALCYSPLVKPESLKGVVHSDPQITGGTPVFVGTRVPLQNLIDYLGRRRVGGGFPRSLSHGNARTGHHSYRRRQAEDAGTSLDLTKCGLRNGDLLKRAQAEFDTFLTADSNLTFQQNLASF